MNILSTKSLPKNLNVFHICCWAFLAIAVFHIQSSVANSPETLKDIQTGSQKAFIVDGNLTFSRLTSHLELLEDPEQEFSFEQVKSSNFNNRFEATQEHSPNFGFTDSAWWVRFTLQNTMNKEQKVTLRQDYPLIDHLDLWHSTDHSQWEHRKTGDRLLFTERDIDHRDFLFPLTVPANSTKTIYMRFQSSGSTNIGLSLYSDKKLLSSISTHQFTYGIYYGGFLVLVIYNFFLFLAVKERLFIHYLLYVVSYGLYMSVHNGFAYQFLWPESPTLANKSLIFFLSLSLFWALKFSRAILNTKIITPRAEKPAFALQITLGLFAVISPFIPYGDIVIPISALTIITTFAILSLATLALLAKSKAAPYFMVAWITLLIGTLIYMAKTFGLISHNAFTHNAFQIGSLIEMVLLSLALGNRVNELKRQTYTDQLTQLFNRRHFDQNLHNEFILSKELNKPLSLLVIDIDYFKQFNDTFGHSNGDKALQAVAKILKKSVRKPHIPCRYGGEEFAVILPNTTLHEANALAERLRESVYQSTAETFKITISVGVSCTNDENFEDLKYFFEAADLALYSAKENGRNCVFNYYDCESKRKIA